MIRKFKPRKKPNYSLITAAALTLFLLVFPFENTSLGYLTILTTGFFIGKSIN